MQSIAELDPPRNLTPEDAYLLSLAEVGMTLDMVPEVSHLPAVETWYRVCQLVVRGLIRAKSV